MKKKTLTIAIALVLVVALAVGATYAYLTAQTEAVKNTFVVGALGNSNLKLEEHVVSYDKATGKYTEGIATTSSGQSYIVQPGVNIPKDPTVTLSNLDVNTGAYVFVGVKGDATETFAWSVDNAVWTPVMKDGTQVMKGEYKIYTLQTGVVTATAANNSTSWKVLKAGTDGTEITVSNNFALAEDQNADSLNIDVIAFACQSAGFNSAYEAFNTCFLSK